MEIILKFPVVQEDISKERDRLLAKMDELNWMMDTVQVAIHALQKQCKHPQRRTYRDMGGDMSSSCPDCGLQS